eukprot:2121766-Prymnesium_polylepis.1
MMLAETPEKAPAPDAPETTPVSAAKSVAFEADSTPMHAETPEEAAAPEPPTPSTPRTPSGRRSSVPTDLQVSFDDGTVVDAHAVILALASPVFSDLLTTDSGTMRSALTLPGKSADQFRIFAEALLPAGVRFSSLTDEAQYITLVHWADEFQVAALKT